MDKNLFDLDAVEKEPYFPDKDSAKSAHQQSVDECKFGKEFIEIIMKLIRDMGIISEYYIEGKYIKYIKKAKNLLEKIEDYDFEIFVAGRELVIYYDEKLVAMRTGGQYEAVLFPSQIMNEMRRRVEQNCNYDYVKDLKKNIKRVEKYLEEKSPKDKGKQLDLFT